LGYRRDPIAWGAEGAISQEREKLSGKRTVTQFHPGKIWSTSQTPTGINLDLVEG
jgi:hypothetical protein